MKKIFLLLAAFFLVGTYPLCAQTPIPTATSAGTDDDENFGEPFKPFWENELGLSSSNQQGGQATNSLSYTRTLHLDQVGGFLAAQVQVSRQKVEGAPSGTGTLDLIGGLGLGFFSPSLSIGYQGGESALRQLNANFSMGFQLSDPWSVNLSVGGNAGNHQGDVTQFYPLLQDLPQLQAYLQANPQAALVQIDTAGVNASLGSSFMPWDWCSFSLTLGYAYDVTYQLELIKHPDKTAPINQADQIGTLTLGMDFVLFKDFVLELDPQVGREYFPAGAVYSPQAGGLVVNSEPYSQNFVGGTTAIRLSFE